MDNIILQISLPGYVLAAVNSEKDLRSVSRCSFRLVILSIEKINLKEIINSPLVKLKDIEAPEIGVIQIDLCWRRLMLLEVSIPATQ